MPRLAPSHRGTARACIGALSAAVVCCALTLALPAPAHAQAWKAQRTARAAAQATRAKDHARAADLYAEAYNQDPKPDYLLKQGLALRQADKPLDAIAALRKLVDAHPDTEQANRATAIIGQLKRDAASLMATVHIKGGSAGLAVFIDDATAPRCTTPCTLTLTPETHTITVGGPDDNTTPETRTVTLAASKTHDLAFDVTARGAVALSVRPTPPPGAQLHVNGAPHATLPLSGPITLPVGQHQLAVVVGKTTRWTDTVSVTGGEPVPVEAVLSEAPTSRGAMSTTAYVLWGVGAVAIGTGVFFGLDAADLEDQVDGQVRDGRTPDPALVQEGDDQSTRANIAFATGAAALGTGVLLFLLDGTTSSDTPADAPAGTSALRLTPALSPRGASVGLSLDF